MENHKIIRSKKKIFLIITGFLLLLSCIRIGWVFYFQPIEIEFSEPGLLDLTHWNLAEENYVHLNGEWLFIPNEFLDESSIIERKAEDGLEPITVPGNWNEHMDTSDSKMPFGYGTYYLKVLLPETESKLWSIKFSELSSAASIYINDELQYNFGEPGISTGETTASFGPLTEVFHMHEDELSIVVHLANFNSPIHGGLTDSIILGRDSSVLKIGQLSSVLQLIIGIIYLLHAVYAFSLYYLAKRKYGKEILYFGIMLVLHGITILIDDEVVLHLPVDYFAYKKILFFLFVGTLLGNVLFIKEFFNINTRGYRLLRVLFSVVLFLIVFAPVGLFIPAGILGITLYVSAIGFLFHHVIRISQTDYPDAILILIFISSYTSNMIWGLLINIDVVSIPFYPFDFLITILAIAILLIRKHIRLSELNQIQTEELKRMDKARDEFLARTSHELRNPLHGIINIAETVLEHNEGTLTKQSAENLQLLANIGKRMGHTLNDLNTITQLRDDKIKLKPESLDLHSLANLVVDMLEFMKEGKQIELVSHIPPDFPKLWADENRMFQILFNLVHNAIKYTDEGSIQLQAKTQGKEAIVYVIDTGIGIDSGLMEKIFDPYEQSEFDSKSHGGIGIGLSVSKQLVELHGGKITFDSGKEGTTFMFSIPLEAMDHKVRADEKLRKKQEEIYPSLYPEEIFVDFTQSPAGTERGTILIVDDDPVNIKVLEQILTNEYTIIASLDPNVVLEEMNLHQIDLVITDIMMPKMSGYQLTQEIRKKYSHVELPVLHITARSTPEDIQISFQSGANEYLMKPIHAMELRIRVRALTNLKYYVKESQKFEAAWLQAQIQPHFLFNTLNTIASLAEVDPDEMIDTLHAFGTYLQESFSIMNLEPTVSIRDAIKLTDAYLQIEKARFGERLHIIRDIDEDVDVEIPPLTIQPLIENAINHGILKKMEGGTVTWSIKHREDDVEIIISDDGAGMSKEKIEEILTVKPTINERVGVKNTNRRLIRLYNKGLEIKSSLGEGTIVRFTIPKKDKS